MTPLIVNGMAIIKCFKYTGIIILAAPMSNTTLTPRELTLKDPNKKVTQAATIPIFAAPLPKPVRLIAVAIATNEIGVTINKENVTQINIDINNGFNSVNLFTKFPSDCVMT